MTALAVDTSALLSIFKGEERGKLWLQFLQERAAVGPLLVSSIVVAEIRSFFPSDQACQKALEALDLQHSSLEEPGALLAGSIFRAYRKAGGPRATILPDFLVAAHAATQASHLATDDRGYLRTYFPKLRIVSPPSI